MIFGYGLMGCLVTGRCGRIEVGGCGVFWCLVFVEIDITE